MPEHTEWIPWPTAPGAYWYASAPGARLLLAQANLTSNEIPILCVATESRFLFRHEVPEARFLPVTLPEPPC